MAYITDRIKNYDRADKSGYHRHEHGKPVRPEERDVLSEKSEIGIQSYDRQIPAQYVRNHQSGRYKRNKHQNESNDIAGHVRYFTPSERKQKCPKYRDKYGNQ
jgi:hypothetical protein